MLGRCWSGRCGPPACRTPQETDVDLPAPRLSRFGQRLQATLPRAIYDEVLSDEDIIIKALRVIS